MKGKPVTGTLMQSIKAALCPEDIGYVVQDSCLGHYAGGKVHAEYFT